MKRFSLLFLFFSSTLWVLLIFTVLFPLRERISPFSCGVSIELSSRTVARKVLSPLQSLTSVFGMGTGGPSAFVTLTLFQASISLDPWKLNNILSKSLKILVKSLNYTVPSLDVPYVLHRKEVIQPHLPIRLPCYDLTPIIEPTFDSCLLAVSPPASGVFNFHGLTGGVYKARERIHRDMLIRDY